MQRVLQDVHPQKHTHAPDSGAMPKQRVAPDARIAANLRRLMEEKELSQLKLGEVASVGQSTISRILAGEDSPTSRTLAKLAGALGVTVNEFFRDVVAADQGPRHYPATDTQPPEYAGTLPAVRRVPVIGTAKLGQDGWYDELSTAIGGGDGYVAVSTSDKNAYALIVRGDSMYPAIRDGWVVVVEPNGTPAAGEYVLVALRDGRKMVKELLYGRRDSVAVISVNGGERITIARDEVEFIHAISAVIPPSKWKH
jgi:phage repressor protein C with HTH and peptisase S24 domain